MSRSPGKSRLVGGAGSGGTCRSIRVDEKTLAMVAQDRLLRPLVATGAGYLGNHAAELSTRFLDLRHTTLLFCQKGGGWAELNGHLRPVRQGQLLIAPPGTLGACGGHSSRPWTVHWIQMTGGHAPEYLQKLALSAQQPVLWVGEDLEIRRLFTEVLVALEHGSGLANLLHAAAALGHLLSLLVLRVGKESPESSSAVKKVAESIIYMSEHLAEPLRVTALARMVNLSPAHFSVLFKDQAGCAPRDYLHLLRIHHACQLLRASDLNIKQIASQVGYQDQFHFSRQFKSFEGLAPTEYRNLAL